MPILLKNSTFFAKNIWGNTIRLVMHTDTAATLTCVDNFAPRPPSTTSQTLQYEHAIGLKKWLEVNFPERRSINRRNT